MYYVLLFNITCVHLASTLSHVVAPETGTKWPNTKIKYADDVVTINMLKMKTNVSLLD